jgi:hypothetical protein
MSAIRLLVVLALAHQPIERPDSSPAATQDSLFVGQVLGRDVYVETLPDDRAARIKELHRLLSKPLFERYHEANRERLDPTQGEMDDYISFLEEHKKKDQQERAARRAELERRLADSNLIPEARAELEKELDGLKWFEARANEPSTLTPEMKRDAERQFAKWWLSRWKLNVALYHDYGGGRVLWQQSGTEAWDATRRFYEAHERDGLLKIPDANLRADFYHYWTADQGPFLSDRVEELLNPPWRKKSASQPATREGLGKLR